METKDQSYLQGTAPGELGKNDGSGKAAGLITSEDITLGELDQGMVERGNAIYDVKCQACHSTGPNRVVGPGWKGITERRQPDWMWMNMILNIDVMLETDPEAQKDWRSASYECPTRGFPRRRAARYWSSCAPFEQNMHIPANMKRSIS